MCTYRHGWTTTRMPIFDTLDSNKIISFSLQSTDNLCFARLSVIVGSFVSQK